MVGGKRKVTTVGEYPAMIATVLVSRRVIDTIAPDIPNQAGARNSPATAWQVLAVAGGIEAATAAQCLIGYPVWETVLATLMRRPFMTDGAKHLNRPVGGPGREQGEPPCCLPRMIDQTKLEYQ